MDVIFQVTSVPEVLAYHDVVEVMDCLYLSVMSYSMEIDWFEENWTCETFEVDVNNHSEPVREVELPCSDIVCGFWNSRAESLVVFHGMYV